MEKSEYNALTHGTALPSKMEEIGNYSNEKEANGNGKSCNCKNTEERQSVSTIEHRNKAVYSFSYPSTYL